MTVAAALDHKGLAYDRVDLQPGPHIEKMAEIYGEDKTTVPGCVIDGEAIHGSVTILERLEQIAPEPTLYPTPIAEAVREAELWGDAELQDLGRRMPWGSAHFRPEAMGTFGGGEALNPAGTDFAIKIVKAAWRHHKITCEILAKDLEGIPEKLDHVDKLVADGIIGDEVPNAADFQIAATIRVMLCVGDLDHLIKGRPAEELAMRWFPDYPGKVPAGAFPAGWVPALSA